MVSSGQTFRNHNCAKRVRSDSNHSAPTSQRSHNYVNEITQRTITGGSPVAFQYDGAPGASNGNLANDGTAITQRVAKEALLEYAAEARAFALLP